MADFHKCRQSPELIQGFCVFNCFDSDQLSDICGCTYVNETDVPEFADIRGKTNELLDQYPPLGIEAPISIFSKCFAMEFNEPTKIFCVVNNHKETQTRDEYCVFSPLDLDNALNEDLDNFNNGNAKSYDHVLPSKIDFFAPDSSFSIYFGYDPTKLPRKYHFEQEKTIEGVTEKQKGTDRPIEKLRNKEIEERVKTTEDTLSKGDKKVIGMKRGKIKQLQRNTVKNKLRKELKKGIKNELKNEFENDLKNPLKNVQKNDQSTGSILSNANPRQINPIPLLSSNLESKIDHRMIAVVFVLFWAILLLVFKFRKCLKRQITNKNHEILYRRIK